jgi:putative two-component system response regulator
MLTRAQIRAGRILVVDDAESDVAVARGILRAAGYEEVLAAERSADAASLYAELRPDLVLLDLGTSPRDGFEVLSDLRSLEPDSYVPVVMMTSRPDPALVLRALDGGAREVLRKPLDALEAVTRIQNMLEMRLLHNQVREQNRALEETVLARTREIEGTRLDVIRRLGRAAEYRDNETGLHIVRISLAASVLGRALGMTPRECDLLLNASPMHDIGKIGIPDRILLKPGPLDDEEWAVMRRHPAIGAELLSGSTSDLMQMAEMIALAHHERWDGTGYPRGLRGEDIPLPARIVAVCDVFDALLSRRPYKEPWTVDASLAELERRAGTHLDPVAVATFVNVLDEVLEIHARYADTRESASHILRASVKLRAAPKARG